MYEKILAISLTLVLVLSLIACGGDVKRKEATDAYNDLANRFNRISTKINENPGVVDHETVGAFASMVERLSSYGGMLRNGEDQTDETYDEMIEWFATADENLAYIIEVVDGTLEGGDEK